jgi:hypothetical protein
MATPPPIPPLSPYVLVNFPEDENAPRQFIPYLYIASPPSPSPTAHNHNHNTPTLPAGNWTHAIRILPASKEHRAGSTSLTEVAPGSPQTQILTLYARSESVPPPTGNSALPLQRRHLLVARDFLALALPYYACAHPSEDAAHPDSPIDPYFSPPPAQRCRTDAVRVLLLGPPRAVLAIALTYIAYASESSVAHVMRCVVDEGEDVEACAVLGEDARMGLGEREMRVLEGLAENAL